MLLIDTLANELPYSLNPCFKLHFPVFGPLDNFMRLGVATHKFLQR